MSTVTVGQVCRALILKNEDLEKKFSNEELAQKVVELFAEREVAVKTSSACIAWYKNDMRKKGILISKSHAKAIVIDLDTIEL